VSFPSRFVNREAFTYYILALPAIVLEVIFSIGIASNPLSDLSTVAGGSLQFVRYLPLLILAASMYAVLAFRPSMLVTLLAFSFFISAVTNSEAGGLGTQGGFGLGVALVILGSFSALIGFNYSRGAKVRSGRELKIDSSGPLASQVISTGFELILPLVITLAMVALVSGVIAAIRVQAQILPEPLATLSSLYLRTRLGLVFISIAVAGALIWASRQLLEPIIMYFTVTHHDAILLALDEVKDITKKVRKVGASRPSAGLSWVIFAVVVAAAIIAYGSVLVGWQTVYNDLISILTYHAPGQSNAESALTGTINNYAREVDNLVNQGEGTLKAIFRLLWG
jgi:hypothetical protein